MRNVVSIFAACIVLTVLAGCDSVVVDAPVGVKLNQTEKTWYVGSWIAEEEQAGGYLEVRRRQDGENVFGTLTWNEEVGEFTAESTLVECRKVSAFVYLFVKEKDSKWYSFVRVEQIDDSRFKLFLPDSDKWREAVESGKVEGEVDDSTGDVVPSEFADSRDSESSNQSQREAVTKGNFVVRLDSESLQRSGLLGTKVVKELEYEKAITYRRVKKRAQVSVESN